MDDVGLDEVLVAEFWEVGAVFNTGSGLETLAIVEGTVVVSAAEEGWEDVATEVATVELAEAEPRRGLGGAIALVVVAV